MVSILAPTISRAKSDVDRIRNERIYGTRPRTMERPYTTETDIDGGESRITLEMEEVASHTSSHSKLLSVSSLLAMKRDRIEKQRRETVNSANQFADSSKRDSMVNSMRTLSMIQSRKASVLPPIKNNTAISIKEEWI